MPDLCTWAYDLAVSWLPPIPSFLWGDTDEGTEAPVAGDEVTTAPGTADALARAKEALHQIETNGGEVGESGPRPLDARFRSASAPLFGGGAGIHRLVGRLQELDVGQLESEDRAALMGAASSLVERLRQSSL